jgi:cytochrome c oxidase cbb3-type subunit I/II
MTNTAESTQLESFSYDDAVVRKFLLATVIWGVVGMLVGVLIALQLAFPAANLELPFTTFGRLRPLHTNAVIFAFAGNAVFAAIYYSSQRLLKTRMWKDGLSNFHFWGWQAIIVSAALTLPMGITQGKEYAELEWPIDLAIAVVWLVFAANLFGTIAKRRERHIYVAIWFYIATAVTVTLLHVFNNLAVPAGIFRSYSIYAGVQDAFMQWWYGHNAVAFLLTTPFLGLMYYFLPKAADRPRLQLSPVHPPLLVAGLHLHLGGPPPPALHRPARVGGHAGHVVLGDALDAVVGRHDQRPAHPARRLEQGGRDPVLKFFVVAVTFYGMSTFEGPMLSIKSVNALSHYTDWTIGHVHSGALGWNGFMAFGMAYWLAPRLFQTELWSKKLASVHFWVGTLGILFYVIPMYTAGITQGLMWRAFDETGRLAYPDFVETVVAILPMYWVRVLGGLMFFSGAVLCLINVLATWANRPARYEVPVVRAASLASEPEPVFQRPQGVGTLGYFAGATWHRFWERRPLRFTVWVVISVVVASLFEIIPTFLIRSNIPTIASVQPYTPLELLGRDVYLAEGCYNCHSQMIRPIRAETERYGEYSKPGEFVWDHPFQWGSRRIGPDLHRVGGKYPDLWHVRHMNNPRDVVQGSIMPSYPWLLTDTMDRSLAQSRVDAMAMLGVPYGDALKNAESMAVAQSEAIAAKIVEQGGPPGLADKKIVALISYLQRLGTDIKKKAPTQAPVALGGE